MAGVARVLEETAELVEVVMLLLEVEAYPAAPRSANRHMRRGKGGARDNVRRLRACGRAGRR